MKGDLTLAGSPDDGHPAPDGVRSAQKFEAFFRASYRPLYAQARYAGADDHEADDAVAAALADVYRHWRRLDEPMAWARRAVVRFYIKAKTHNLDRVRAQQVRHQSGTPYGREDANLTTWEEWQWIKQMLLDRLTDDQREVMALILDGYAPAEISDMINIRADAVRKRLSVSRQRLAEAWIDASRARLTEERRGAEHG